MDTLTRPEVVLVHGCKDDSLTRISLGETLMEPQAYRPVQVHPCNPAALETYMPAQVHPCDPAALETYMPVPVHPCDPAALERYIPVPVHPTVPAVEEHLTCRPDRYRGPSSALVCRDG